MCRAQERLDIDLAQLSWSTNSSYSLLIFRSRKNRAWLFFSAEKPGLAFFFRDLKLSLRWGTCSSVSIQVHLYPQLKREFCFF